MFKVNALGTATKVQNTDQGRQDSCLVGKFFQKNPWDDDDKLRLQWECHQRIIMLAACGWVRAGERGECAYSLWQEWVWIQDMSLRTPSEPMEAALKGRAAGASETKRGGEPTDVQGEAVCVLTPAGPSSRELPETPR